MSPPDKEFEDQLASAGKKHLDPPSSVDDLLPLLDVDNEATSAKSEVGSGVNLTDDDYPSTDSISVKKHEDAYQKTLMETTGVSSNVKYGKSDNGKEDKKVHKPKKSTRKQGRKQSTVKKSTKPVDSTHIDGEKEAEQSVDNDKDAKSDHPSSPKGNQSAEADMPSEAENECNVAPPPKEEENESKDVSSPSKSAQTKKIEESLKEAEGQSDSEGKEPSEVGKKTEDEASDEDGTPATGKTSREGSEATDVDETNSPKQSPQKADVSNVDKGGASTESLKKKKGLMKGEMGRATDKASSSREDGEKEEVSSSKSLKKHLRDEDKPDETPKKKVKQKRAPVKEVGSDINDYGQELVGSRVKVLWPDDKEMVFGIGKKKDQVAKRIVLFESVRCSHGSDSSSQSQHSIAVWESQLPRPPPPPLPVSGSFFSSECGSSGLPTSARRVLGDARLRGREEESNFTFRKKRGVCRVKKAGEIHNKTRRKIQLVWDPVVKGPDAKGAGSIASHDIGSTVRGIVSTIAPTFDDLPEQEKSPRFKRYPGTNKKNRAEKTMHHRTSSTPIVYTMEELRRQGEDLSIINGIEKAYVREGDQSMEANYDQMLSTFEARKAAYVEVHPDAGEEDVLKNVQSQ